MHITLYTINGHARQNTRASRKPIVIDSGKVVQNLTGRKVKSREQRAESKSLEIMQRNRIINHMDELKYHSIFTIFVLDFISRKIHYSMFQ